MKQIAILGATGYIGKSLVCELIQNSNFELVLFSRDLVKLRAAMSTLEKGEGNAFTLRSLDEFMVGRYDVIINATGIGNTAEQRENASMVFTLTEEIDDLILNYLNQNPQTQYINLSSGAVFGNGFSEAITDTSHSNIAINNLRVADYYSVAKLNAEAKHRAHSQLRIVDLRVYAFFSHFVDTSTEFLMSEIVSCLKDKCVFKTSAADITRDYITPKDLSALIECVIEAGFVNDAFDVCSLGAVTKFELLTFLQDKYGLVYEVDDTAGIKSGLGKNVYLSKSKKAHSLGYEPKFTSLEGIAHELDLMKKDNLL